MNEIRITLQADAAAENIERAHDAINAFFGRPYGTSASVAVLDTVAAHGGAARSIEHVATEQSAGVVLDTNGLPWDERIHASTKTQTQKGEWTKRKGADDKTIGAVLAELRKMYPEPQAPQTPASVVVPTKTQPVVALAPKSEYQKLCDFIATNVASGKIAQETIDSTFAQYKTSLAALAGDEASSTAYREAFEQFIA